MKVDIERARKELNELGELYLKGHTRPIKYTSGYDLLKATLEELAETREPRKVEIQETPMANEEILEYINELNEKWFDGPEEE